MSTIYKPVADGESGFIFTIDDGDENENGGNNNIQTVDGSTGFDDDYNDDDGNGGGLHIREQHQTLGTTTTMIDVSHNSQRSRRSVTSMHGDDHENTVVVVEPMEISSSWDAVLEGQALFRWTDPWLPTALVTLCLIVPCTLWSCVTYSNLLGVWFPATPWALHMVGTVVASRHVVVAANSQRPTILQSRGSRTITTVVSAVDIVLLGVVYQLASRLLIQNLFTDLDGTICVEWSHVVKELRIQQALAFTAALLRMVIGANAIGLRLAMATLDSSFVTRTSTTWWERFCCFNGDNLHSCPSYRLAAPFLYLDSRLGQSLACPKASSEKKRWIRQTLFYLYNFLLVSAIALSGVCLYSAALHIWPWPAPPATDANCDPLDPTECWLPFPSFHHLSQDDTTVTTWRVNLKSNLLPKLKSRVNIQMDFLNDLDGFSTMAPLLFYLEGLKEAHEAGSQQLKHENIGESVTEASVTLLLDVETHELVPHTAEIDYLDGQRPLVMVFPAEPLKHNCHYAVAVLKAKDQHDKQIPPTIGMEDLLKGSPSSDEERKRRYVDVLIPALEQAAPWYVHDDEPLQLLFDFQTISAESQLGPVRAVRDATVQAVSDADWHWEHHVRTMQQIDSECSSDYDDDSDTQRGSIARTVHAELDVPWFLTSHGAGARSAILNSKAVRSSRSRLHLEPIKFIAHIPCSLKAAALEQPSGVPLQAVMEFGHGLFGHRGESFDSFLADMAHDQGYVIVAMDWRGMSSYDLLVVAKVLISAPHMFQSVRDNLIQGYAAKYALQHFSRHALTSMDWLTFSNAADDGRGNGGGGDPPTLPSVLGAVPTLNNQPPAHVFYGISQGGILGAGYSALSGPTGLIDRAILGSPGTPFALVMTRSLDFLLYDKLLLLDLYDNRNVRMLLTLVQMGWDSVEASGVLAKPIVEAFPPVLIQAGLGDVIVPAVAAESLARAFGATTLENAPRDVFGISQASSLLMDGNHGEGGSSSHAGTAAFTELMYDAEFQTLLPDNLPQEFNSIHYCVRHDEKLISQIKKFVNTGEIENPCLEDGCHRASSIC